MATFTNTRSEMMPAPLAKCAKSKGAHSRSGLGPVGIGTTASRVYRPHLEDVGRAVGEAGHRMGRVDELPLPLIRTS